MSSLYQKAQFVLSAANITQLPADKGIEVAIVGRSNAGKSSVLNRLTHQKSLARVSRTPGRTQLVNVFQLDETRRIIDLPGYGFANVPAAAQEKWQKTVDAYIRTRSSLRGLVVVMDIRHPLKPLDRQLLHYCDERDLPVHILLNKADKLSKGAAEATKHEVETVLAEAYKNPISLQTFSALKNEGIKILQLHLNEWYDYKIG